MAAVASIPYDFNELRTPKAGHAFTEEDLTQACAEARADALRENIIAEAKKQTELLNRILDIVESSRSAFHATVPEQRDALTQTSRAFIERYCRNVATKRESDAALALLDEYLALAPDRKPVLLALPEHAAKEVIALLEDGLNERGVSDFVEISASNTVADGDCRIEWRGGAMARNLDEMIDEIDRIFSSLGEGRIPTPGKASS